MLEVYLAEAVRCMTLQ